MEGKTSIKKVLPAICPELSSSNLEGDGMTDSNSFLELYSCDDAEVISSTRENLLKYCHLNTLAMVRILEVLQKVWILNDALSRYFPELVISVRARLVQVLKKSDPDYPEVGPGLSNTKSSITFFPLIS